MKPTAPLFYWNKASELLYGYSKTEAIGRNLLELIIPLEMRQGVQQAIRQMVQSGEAEPAEELLLQRKDGSRVAVYSGHAVVTLPGKPAQDILYGFRPDGAEKTTSPAAAGGRSI